MKDNFTSINVLIDRSGSMSSLVDDTIGGFNTFLKEQKAVPGEAIFSLSLFDYEYEQINDCVPISEAQELTVETYVPRGSTALLDALGRMINATGSKLSAMREEDRPSKIIFLIITDGQENASKEMKHDKIKEMVKHQTEKYNWLFVYLGANVDAFSVGDSIGISGANSYNYSGTRKSTQSLYSNISQSLTSSRAIGATMDSFTIDASALIDKDDKGTDTTTK